MIFNGRESTNYLLRHAVKLGISITGPWASTYLKPTGPTLISLAQIIFIHRETYTLPYIFYHRGLQSRETIYNWK